MNSFFFSALPLFLTAACCGAEHLPLKQPPVPEGMTEIPFVETAPLPFPTAEETRRGMILFSRPLVEPVFPQTRPLEQERISALSGFAARGEHETLNFALYPLRNLREVRVSSGDWRTDSGALLPASSIRIRLVTFWNVKYPIYLSHQSYRRMPEFLESVSCFPAPEREPQRIFLTVSVPEDAAAGIYHGKIAVACDGKNAAEIPVSFRVLPFSLRQDPAKAYSAYHSVIYREPQWSSRGRQWLDRTLRAEYRTMRELGINAAPNLYLSYVKDGKGGKLGIPFLAETLAAMQSAGLRPPIPVVGCGIFDLYHRFTGGTMRKHIVVSEAVPEALYAELDRLVKAWKKEMLDKQWPEMIFCPLDEISPQSIGIGVRVYRIFHENGLKTFATKDPAGDSTAKQLAPYVDYWCTAPYSIKYEEILKDRRHGYWCYPNHNAYEIKDPLTMCKGGRMTYGFGNWRSGYTRLMPWVWRSGNRNHLAPNRDAGGNRLEEDGSVTVTPYWIAFQEGIDDARYLYTLQDAVVRREGSADPTLKRLTAEARRLLQKNWDDIRVQPKYLRDGMWDSAEFDARRWQLASMIGKLLAWPELNSRTAPSVLVDPGITQTAENEFAELYRTELRNGNIQELDLGKNAFENWNTRTGEMKLLRDKNSILLDVKVDFLTDGEGTNGLYKVGWPRMFREFPRPGLDAADYDFFLLRLNIDSNRNEVADDRTPMFLSVVSFSGFKKDYYFLDQAEQRQWLDILYPVSAMTAMAPPDAFRTLKMLQLGINESHYAHGDHLKLNVERMAFLRFLHPLIRHVETSSLVLLPADWISFSADFLGRPGKDCRLRAMLLFNGKRIRQREWPLAERISGGLPANGLSAGNYLLEFEVVERGGNVLSRRRREIQLLPGPFAT